MNPRALLVFGLALLPVAAGQSLPADVDLPIQEPDAPRDSPLPLPDAVQSPDYGFGVVSGVGLALLGYWAFFRGGAKLVTRENVLENPVRADVYTLLRERPGVHLRKIAQEMGLSTTNALWHLRKLERAGLVSFKDVSGYKVYYAREGGLETTRRAIANSVLSKDNARTILDFLAAHPGAHQRETARALGVNHGTVRWHLKKMVEAGIVTEVRHDVLSQYFPTPYAYEILRPAATAPATPDTARASA